MANDVSRPFQTCMKVRLISKFFLQGRRLRYAFSIFVTFVFISEIEDWLCGSKISYIIKIHALHYSCNRVYDKEDGYKAIKNDVTKIAAMFLYENIITQYDCLKVLVSDWFWNFYHLLIQVVLIGATISSLFSGLMKVDCVSMDRHRKGRDLLWLLSTNLLVRLGNKIKGKVNIFSVLTKGKFVFIFELQIS